MNDEPIWQYIITCYFTGVAIGFWPLQHKVKVIIVYKVIVAITNPQYKYENQREKQQKFHFCSLTLHNLTSYNKIMREEWGLYIGPNHPISLKIGNIFNTENNY